MRALPAPCASSTVRTWDGGRRRSPIVTSAFTHSGAKRSAGSRRTGTAKSSHWPRTAPPPPAPRPAANANGAAMATTIAVIDARQNRLFRMQGGGR